MRASFAFFVIPAALVSFFSTSARAQCPAPPPPGPGVRTVTNTNNAGAGSLRAALNAAVAGDTIRFAPALCGQVIVPAAALPPVSQGQIKILGCAPGNEVILAGAGLPPPATPALQVTSSDNRICGLLIRDAPVGLAILSGSRNVVDANRFVHNQGPALSVRGPGATVDNELRANVVEQSCWNAGGIACAGIEVAGGTQSAAVLRTRVLWNLVSANGTPASGGSGIALLDGHLHQVLDNLVGTDATGGLARGNHGDGVLVERAQQVEIGRNQISANGAMGLRLATANDAQVHDNVIGDALGGALGNAMGGVLILGGSGHLLSNNTIRRNLHLGVGLDAAGAEGATLVKLLGNTIEENTGVGVAFANDVRVHENTLEANTIASNGNAGIAMGPASFANRFTRNAIFDNGGCAISLGGGGNFNQPAPTVTGSHQDLVAGTVTVTGTIEGGVAPVPEEQPPAQRSGEIEVFWGPSPSAIATNYLGSVSVQSGASLFRLTVPVSSPLPPGAVFTATLTERITTNAWGTIYNTSALGESCDGLDQDCDGLADEDFDHDQDGYTTCGGDCDDGDPSKSGADLDGDGVSTCGGDCCEDALVGAGKSTLDADGDGVSACAGDSDDADPAVFPAGIERCNGLDDDGDGTVDDGFDWDGDGASTCPALAGIADCNDRDPLIAPLAIERCDNAKDDDCDGLTDEWVDADGDGFSSSCVGPTRPIDPDDTNAALVPADPDGDGNVLGDCDEGDPAKNTQDYDGDGYDSCATTNGIADCDDSDPTRTTNCALPRAPRTHTITVNADGSFSPAWTWIKGGDTVEWSFPPLPAPASFSDPLVHTDAIAEVDWVGGVPALCSAFTPAAHVDPLGVVTTDPNDFTGPKVAAASGIFALGSDMPPYAIAEETWSDGRTSGVFLRYQWKDVHKGPGVFDFRSMDAEIARAVAHGKLFSLGFKAGNEGMPSWIFSTACGCAGATPEISFQDPGANDNTSCSNAPPESYGRPGDPSYTCHYLELLKAVADHVRTRSAWYRALAYIKISGANLVSQENRLPMRCDCDPDCNAKIWADADYTPSSLYAFYAAQTAGLLAWYPSKLMSYALIQDGFPIVNDCKDYELADGTCSSCVLPGCTSLPGAFEQTQHILDDGQQAFGKSFVVQHNGLGPANAACSFAGLHPQPTTGCTFDDPADACVPAPGEACFFDGSDDVCDLNACPDGCYWDPGGCPNKWAVREGAEGQLTGFQTNNPSGDVATLGDLDETLQNLWTNSDGVFLEIYESILLQSQPNWAVVGPSGNTLGAWSLKLHDRLKGTDTSTAWGTAEPFPASHRHTFVRTLASSEAQVFRYVHASRCADAGGAHWGAVAILPD
jgi:hypothetical protein